MGVAARLRPRVLVLACCQSWCTLYIACTSIGNQIDCSAAQSLNALPGSTRPLSPTSCSTVARRRFLLRVTSVDCSSAGRTTNVFDKCSGEARYPRARSASVHPESVRSCTPLLGLASFLSRSRIPDISGCVAASLRDAVAQTASHNCTWCTRRKAIASERHKRRRHSEQPTSGARAAVDIGTDCCNGDKCTTCPRTTISARRSPSVVIGRGSRCRTGHG